MLYILQSGIKRLYPAGLSRRTPSSTKSAAAEPEKLHETCSLTGRRTYAADVCSEICESILDLERAFETGKLRNRLTSGCFEKVLGLRIFEIYRKLAGELPGHMHHLRTDAVLELLAQLQNDLISTRVARAERLIYGNDVTSADEPWSASRSRLPFKLAVAGFDGGSSVAIRFEQMLDARFWRIGFEFDTPDLCGVFARMVVFAATQRLAGNLRDLQRILERLNHRTLYRNVKIVPNPSEKRFEHLILDILNEHERHAVAATLLEDFFEKTDIRVKYAGVKRRRGSRVQVTSTIAPEFHKAKLQAIKMPDEFVFLSPLSLAEFVDYLQGGNLDDLPPGLPIFQLASLWDCLDKKPSDVPQLAYELKRILCRALTGTFNSPLGPMALVPLPVRQLIRFFAETRAIASTESLREREKRMRCVWHYKCARHAKKLTMIKRDRPYFK